MHKVLGSLLQSTLDCKTEPGVVGGGVEKSWCLGEMNCMSFIMH